MLDNLTEHQRIIKRLGGIRKLSRLLGHRNASTVQGWFQRGQIPAAQMEKVLSAVSQVAA
nr:hypothetical protein [Sphingomonas laterariae]